MPNISFAESATKATQGFQFWTSITGTVTSDAAQFKDSPRSIKCDGAAGNAAAYVQKDGVLTDAGARISYYVRLTNLPASTVPLLEILNATSLAIPLRIDLSSAGVLTLVAGNKTTTGSSLVTGTWYGITLSYIVTNSALNQWRVFLNGLLDITILNATLTNINTSNLLLGWVLAPGANNVLNIDHPFVDLGQTVDYPGDVRVTAKLAAAVNNNAFDTTTGTGAVNERPISEANNKNHLATTQVLQDYTLEAASVGDVNITGAVLVGHIGWMWSKRGAGGVGTPGMALNGAITAVTLTTTSALYTKIITSTSYPSNVQGIGERSSGAGADTFLYECGVLIVYIPAAADPFPAGYLRRVQYYGA